MAADAGSQTRATARFAWRDLLVLAAFFALVVLAVTRAPPAVEQAAGVLVAGIAIIDVFLTVLFARAGAGIVSDGLARLVWACSHGSPRGAAT